MTDDNWTTPVDPIAGVIVRPDYITYSLQNILALKNAIMGDVQATGEVIQRILSGTNAARPAAGNAGRYYYATDDPKCIYMDTGAAWIIAGGEVPRVRAYKSGNQTIANATATAISFDTQRYDNDTMWTVAPNPTRITFTKAGTYDVGACISWGASDVGRLQVYFLLNSADIITLIQNELADSASRNCVQNLSTHWQFAAADYIEVYAYQDSGGNLSVLSSAKYSPEVWATFVSV